MNDRHPKQFEVLKLTERSFRVRLDGEEFNGITSPGDDSLVIWPSLDYQSPIMSDRDPRYQFIQNALRLLR